MAITRALAITTLVSLVVLVVLPDAFAIPFSTILSFDSYTFNTPKSSVTLTLQSLEGVEGWGLPAGLADAVYFAFIPASVFVCLVVVTGLWASTASPSQDLE